MTTIEKVRKMMDEGLKPREMADELDCKIETIYTYRHMIKKEDESNDQKAVSNNKKTKKVEGEGKMQQKIKDLENINENHLEMLRIEKGKLKKAEEKLEDVEYTYAKLEKEYDELTRFARELEEKHKRFQGYAQSELQKYSEKNEAESVKHDLLLKYLVLTNSDLNGVEVDG